MYHFRLTDLNICGNPVQVRNLNIKNLSHFIYSLKGKCRDLSLSAAGAITEVSALILVMIILRTLAVTDFSRCC